jgi:hypothetical protein
MKTTDVKTSPMGPLLVLLAILSGIFAKAYWPGVDAWLVIFIIFALGVVIMLLWNLLWNRAGKSKDGGYGVDDTGDGDGSGDGSAGDSGGAGF